MESTSGGGGGGGAFGGKGQAVLPEVAPGLESSSAFAAFGAGVAFFGLLLIEQAGAAAPEESQSKLASWYQPMVAG